MFLLSLALACDSSKDNPDDSAAPTSSFDPDHFLDDALATAITTEPCTLSGGAEATCYRVEVNTTPSDHAVGPFCPRHIDDDASAAGIWVEDGEVWDASGAFIADLATFYNDPNWQLYDPSTGDIFVTDTYEACEAAARPDVDPAYQNYCVECSLDYVEASTQTYLIPTTPVPLDSPDEVMGGVVGLAFNGVNFDPPAPVDAILSNYTIAAFDDCGGHINLQAGYHYHAATGCPTEVAQTDGHAALLGVAMDGYGLYGRLDPSGAEPDDLDECRGHTDDTRGYHYHVASAGENMFIGCFHGQQGEREGDGGPP